MKIVNEEYEISCLPVKEQSRIKSLLEDLSEINNLKIRPELNIYWQEWHDSCSPERTDPCPDYYGYYTLRIDPYESLGEPMNINELDNLMCYLTCYLVNEN